MAGFIFSGGSGGGGAVSSSLVTTTGGTTARTLADHFAGVGNIKDFGAVGDGTSHPLSGAPFSFGSLAAAQAVYPFVTSLSQETDWAAITAAQNYNTSYLPLAVAALVDTATTTAASNGTTTITIGGGVSAAVRANPTRYKFVAVKATSTSASATVTANINTLTIGGSITGTFAAGQTIQGTNFGSGLYITQQLTGSAGGAGTYQLNSICEAAATAITAVDNVILDVASATSTTVTLSTTTRASFTGSITSNVLTVTGWSGLPLVVGDVIIGAGVTAPTTITSFGSGTGGNGTYNVTATANVGAEAMTSARQIPNGTTVKFMPYKLEFASIPSTVSAFNYYAYDLTNLAAGGGGITALTSTLVTLSQGLSFAGSGAALGDIIAMVTSNAGNIYFPPGDYQLGSDYVGGFSSVCFIGSGTASVIRGSTSNYMFDWVAQPYNPGSGTITMENLKLENSHAGGGCVRFGYVLLASCYSCTFVGDIGVVYTQSSTEVNSVAFNGGLYNCDFEPRNAWSSGSLGYMLTNNNVAMCCDVTRFETGGKLTGTSCSVIGGRYEVNGTALALGIMLGGGADSVSSFLISGASFESNSTAIYMRGGAGTITGCIIQGFNGAAPNGLNPQYGIRCNDESTTYTTFSSIRIGGTYDIASFSVSPAGAGNLASSLYNTYISVLAGNSSTTPGAVGWEMPLGPGWRGKWIECPFVTDSQLFANLPTDAGTGDTHLVSDSVDPIWTGGGASNCGKPITVGGGSNSVLVRRTGSGWVING